MIRMERREDFERRYSQSMLNPVAWGVTHLSVPCTCDEDTQPLHWCAIRLDLDAVEEHFRHEIVLADLRRERTS